MKALPPPPYDPRNQRVFFEFAATVAAERRTVGKIIVEVFEDVGPPARAFVAACTKDTFASRAALRRSFSQSRIHTMLPGYYFQATADDQAARGVSEGDIRAGALKQFAHSIAGLVSVAGGSKGVPTELLITLADDGVPSLDRSSCVIGRVVDDDGMSVLRELERLHESRAGARLVIADCGMASTTASAPARASGGLEQERGGTETAGGERSPAPAAASVPAAIDVKASVKDALEMQAAASGRQISGGAAGRAGGVKRMWSHLSDEDDEDDEDDNDSDNTG